MTNFIPSHRNEEEREELWEQLNEIDPPIDLLRMLNEDKENLWDFKYYGDKDFFLESKGENEN